MSTAKKDSASIVLLIISIVVLFGLFSYLSFSNTVTALLLYNESDNLTYYQNPLGYYNSSTLPPTAANDTLQSVTDRGSTTTNSMTIDAGGLTNSVLRVNGATDSYIRSTATDLLQFGHGGSPRLTINSVGDVGIGDTTPDAKLDVEGDAIITEGATIGTNSNNGLLQVEGVTQFGLITPSFTFDASTGSLESGMNVIATPVSSFGSAIALGVNLDTSNSPIYTVEANGQQTFAVHGKALGSRAVAIGAESYANAESSTAIGYDAEVTGQASYGIGLQTRINGFASYGIGSGAYVDADNSASFAFGKVTADNSIAIGLRGTAGFNSQYYDLNKEDTFAVTLGDSASPKLLFEYEAPKGMRIGATTGESITMDGDDLYVTDNAEIDGFLVLGANTEAGLSAGDINASTIYYDTLVAKSPIFQCSEGTGWCEIVLPEYQTSLFVEFDDVFNPVRVVFANQEYTINEFLTQICTINAETQSVCNEIADKYVKLKAKREAELSYTAFVSNCAYEIEGNECVRYTTQNVFYEDAVIEVETPVQTKIPKTCYELNETLQPESYTCYEFVNSGETKTEYKFKDNCSWTQEGGYDCVVRQTINIYQ